MRPPSTPEPLVLAAVLLGVVAVFAPTLGYGFVRWDDPQTLHHNPLLLTPGEVPLRDHLLTPTIGYPIPLTVLTYRLDHALVGLEGEWLYHLSNVVFHLVAVALLFGLARAFGLGLATSALVALLVGAHPAAAEPVAWITGRKDVLALLFAVAALRLTWPASSGAPSPRRRLARFALFAAAVASKPSAAALAPVLALAESLRLRDAEPRPAWLPSLGRGLVGALPELLLLAASAPITYLAHRAYGGFTAPEAVDAPARLAWYGLGQHLAIATLIEETTAKYLPAPFPPPFRPAIDLLPIAALLLLAALLRRAEPPARRRAALALAWAAAIYLPYAGLVPLNRRFADSYVYGSLPGLALALGVLVDPYLRRRASELPRAVGALVACVALLLGLTTVASAARFRNTAALWEHVTERYPHSAEACRSWAVAMRELAGPEEVLRATDRCIARLGPAPFAKNRAIALFELGRLEEAAQWMRAALAADPSDRDAPPALLALAEAPPAPTPPTPAAPSPAAPSPDAPAPTPPTPSVP